MVKAIKPLLAQVHTTARLGSTQLMIETATHMLRSVLGKTPQTDETMKLGLQSTLARANFSAEPGFCSSTKFADVSKPGAGAKANRVYSSKQLERTKRRTRHPQHC